MQKAPSYISYKVLNISLNNDTYVTIFSWYKFLERFIKLLLIQRVLNSKKKPSLTAFNMNSKLLNNLESVY